MPTPPIADSTLTWELVTSGGVSGMVLLGLLVLLSLVAFALACEQFLSLRRSRLSPEGLGGTVRKRLESGDLVGARKACDGGGMLGEVLASALDEAQELAGIAGPTWPAVEKAMEETAEAYAARLARPLDYLAMIGNIAPMVGLLGTVVGMIFAFREVAITEGAATPAQLASGIYSALVTTVGGLVIAIPTLGAYTVLRNRVDEIAAEVVVQAEAATRPLKRALSGHSAPLRLKQPTPTPPGVV